MSKRSKLRHASEKKSVADSRSGNATQGPKPYVAITGMDGPLLERLSPIFETRLLPQFAAESLTAEVVIFEAGLSDIEAMLGEQSGSRIFALYQSPWEAVVAVHQDRLANYLPEWLSYHAGLLRLRQRSGGRLQLVNAKRLDDSAQLFFEEIGTRSSKALGDFPASPAADAVNPHAVLWAKSFEWMAPEYWDVYEAFESCAWLGNGEPEYRDSLPALDSGDLTEVAAGWRGALSMPQQVVEVQAELKVERERALAAESELLALREQTKELAERVQLREEELLTNLQQQDDARREAEQKLAAKLQAAEVRAKESLSESEKLLAQLHQVQETLESTYLQAGQAAQNAAAVRSGLEQEKLVLAERVKKLEGEMARSEAAGKIVAAEKAKLLAEVDRLGKELAKSIEASKAAEVKHQQNARARDEQERTLRTTVGALETRAKEAESEAELLLRQLHEVQEQLEHYFMKSQDATKALEQSTESFNRARRVVAQLMNKQAA